MFNSSWDCTYIDRSFTLSFIVMSLEFLGPHLYRSVIVISVKFEFLGSYLYRSVIFLSVCVKSESGPHLYRSVIHRLVSLSLSFWSRTYIDRSSSCQFVFSLSWDRTYIDQSFSCQFSLSFSGPHLYRSIIHLISSIRVFRDYTYINQSFILSV